MPKGSNLEGKRVKFGEGQKTEGAGRKKKIYTILKESGYGADDIKTAFGEMAFSTLTDLKAIHTDESKPIILRIIANQFYQALKTSDYKKIDELMKHVIGLPKQSLQLSNDTENPITIFQLPDNNR